MYENRRTPQEVGGYPPLDPPPPPLPMFEADSQNFASTPSVPRGLKLQNFWPDFGGDHRGTLGGGGGVPATPPSPCPPLLIHPCPRPHPNCRARATSWPPLQHSSEEPGCSRQDDDAHKEMDTPPQYQRRSRGPIPRCPLHAPAGHTGTDPRGPTRHMATHGGGGGRSNGPPSPEWIWVMSGRMHRPCCTAVTSPFPSGRCPVAGSSSVPGSSVRIQICLFFFTRRR